MNKARAFNPFLCAKTDKLMALIAEGYFQTCKIRHRPHIIWLYRSYQNHPHQMSFWVKAIESVISRPQPMHHTKRTPVSPWKNAVILAIIG